MHTRCCEELLKFPGAELEANAEPGHMVEVNTTDIETVPAIVDVRFKGKTSPGAGDISTYNGTWDGSKVRRGSYSTAMTNAQISSSFAALNDGTEYEAGFTVEFPGGIGRMFGIHNGTNQRYYDVFISIRKAPTLVQGNDTVKARK